VASEMATTSTGGAIIMFDVTSRLTYKKRAHLAP
jgi:hypothetical protein